MNSLPVFGFEEAIPLDCTDPVELLGGKGAGLLDMRQRLGLPVPPGFVIGTPLCDDVLDRGWPSGLSERVDVALRDLERRTGRVLGDAERPLLVSVRSGARISMPGMMDTILNLGSNARTIEALARSTGNRRFALDTWWRFCRMYAKTVLDMPDDVAGDEPDDTDDETALLAGIATLRRNCEARGRPIPDEPRAQLAAAIDAVFRSCRSERARVYCERERIAGPVPSAVVIQAMVFGNLGMHSGTGVAFTRNPSTGEARPMADFLPNAQGEAVVAGIRRTLSLEDMARLAPDAHRQLQDLMPRLERHYRDLCDIEFTVEAGRLYLLQARVGKRSARAAVRLAVELTRDPVIALSKAEAIRRISAEVVGQLRAGAVVAEHAAPIAQGVGVSPGVVSGVACTHPDRVAELVAAGRRVVLVREDTSPHDVHGMVASAAIVTATGGQVSHAALVARAWGIAGVCGVESLRFTPRLSIGGQMLREGDWITVDGDSGAVYLGDQARATSTEPPELELLRSWAAELGLELGEPSSHSADHAHNTDLADAAGKFSGDGNVPADESPHATGIADEPSSDGNVPALSDFALVRALGLSGFANTAKLAMHTGVPAGALEERLNAVPPGLVAQSPRGWHLTPQGRHWLTQALGAERASIDAARTERVFLAFSDLDVELKLVITDWQLRTVDGRQVANDHTDRAYDDAVLARVAALHARLLRLWPEVLGLTARLAPFEQRFERAAAAIAQRDGSMIASPLKDSYHTIWFELHEELIHLSGRDRSRDLH